MAMQTRLPQALGIAHPGISAPMAFAAGGRLAPMAFAAGGLPQLWRSGATLIVAQGAEALVPPAVQDAAIAAIAAIAADEDASLRATIVGRARGAGHARLKG
jgi:hypothetical protein